MSQLFYLISLINIKNFIYVLIFIILLSLADLIGFLSIPLFVKFFLDPGQASIYIKKYLYFINTDFFNHNIEIKFGILIIIYFCLKNIFNYFFLKKKTKYVSNFIFNLKTFVFQGYLNQPYNFFVNQTSGILIRNLTTELEKIRYSIVELISVIKEIILLVVLFILAFAVNIYASMMALFFFLFLSFIFLFFVKPKIKQAGIKLQKQEGLEFKTVVDTLSSIKIIKILSKEKFFLNFFSKNLINLETTRNFFYVIYNSPKIFFESFVIIFGISLCIYFLQINNSTADSIVILSTFMIISIRLIPAYNIITGGLSAIKYNKKSVKLIYETILNIQKTEIKSKYKKISNIDFKFNDNIKIKDLSFYYSKKNILNIENLVIYKNKFHGIMGESGSGKSTFLDIISLMQKFTSGSITVSNQNILDFEYDWKKLIGYVPQDTILIDDALKKNIAFGITDDEIDTHLIKELIKKMDLTNFVDNLDNGIDTNVGDKGLKMSGGQKQRIGIARALYFNPKILLLDESTSSLDIETEKNILLHLKNISKDKMTVLFSTHRQSSLDICDIVYKVKNKSIKIINHK